MMAKGEVGKGHSFLVAAHQLAAAGMHTQVALKHKLHKQETESRINVFKQCPFLLLTVCLDEHGLNFPVFLTSE